jgi:hypothetical protein
MVRQAVQKPVDELLVHVDRERRLDEQALPNDPRSEIPHSNEMESVSYVVDESWIHPSAWNGSRRRGTLSYAS